MNIVIDCFKLVKGSGKSIGIYNLTYNLVKNLAMEKEHSENAEFVNSNIYVLGNEYNKSDFQNKNINFIEIKNLNPYNKIHCLLWELFVVLFYAKKCKADRLIFPRGFSAIFHPIKDIVIIHDMIPFYYNEFYPNVLNKYENFYIMKRLKMSAKKSYKIVTDSYASKEDIIKYSNCDANKVKVIYPGCNEIKIGTKDDCEIKIQEPYISAITSYLPHKNAIGILKSYEQYYQISKNPLKLVIIGISETSSIYKLPNNIRDNIICIKYIKNDEDMHRIIKNSKLFLFLSLKEGFGFPPLEATMIDVPTICSNTSSLPEILEKMVKYVDPNDYSCVAKKTNEIITSEYRKINREIHEKIKKFDWKMRIKNYIEVIIET